MKHLKIFESFKSEYDREIKVFLDKYINEVENYLHELSDEFPINRIDISAKIFSYYVKFQYSDFENFKLVAHQGIFNRIIDDYPGTEIKFNLKISPSPTSFAATFSSNQRDIEDLFPIITRSIEKIKSESKAGNFDENRCTITILFDIS